jgi:hypothetical protein
MSDAKSEVSKLLEEHGRKIDELRDKLASVHRCDKDKLSRAVEKYKAAHKTFHDDALACVGF